MNSRFAHAFALATAAAAFASAALIASSPAYAESPTIDTTPFVSTRTRAEVQAEVMSQTQVLSASAREWTLQRNQPEPLRSASTGEQVRAAYLAAREEVSALTSEDSGSSYLAAQRMRIDGDPVVARLAH
ncbi:MAG TPA: hypothetical protein VGE20_06135 [Ramlibacter sp.]